MVFIDQVMAALVPKIQKMVFEDGQLAVSKEMREATAREPESARARLFGWLIGWLGGWVVG